MAAKLVEDRYIVLFPCHVIREQEPKNKEPEARTTQNKNTNTTKTTHTKKAENHTAQKQWRDGYQLGEKDLLRQEVIA